MKFPFGKFKGTYIDDIETSYLIYALENFDMKGDLYNAIKLVIASRFNINPPTVKNVNFKSIYLTMAKRFHPDKGGSNEAMQAINEFYYLLCNQ
jgi:hypothetical protein